MTHAHPQDISHLAILLVEPSAMQRRLIEDALISAGCTQVESVADLPEAIVSIERYHPDLIISALYLPSGTGTELIYELRGHDELAGVAFMLISSEQKLEHLDPVRQAGAVAILPKPFKIEDLRRALLATLDYYQNDELELDHYDIADLRLLVVDDSHTARKHICRILNKMGVTSIIEAENGAEALALLEEQSVDLVVTDYNMPVMDGEELISGIRQHPLHAHIPIMMVTSEHSEARLSAVRQAGVDAICDKPFEVNEVKRMLRAMLNA
ncbi:response regulator transcription factor [Balneatrix alpica]|uniref:Response regulator n=1 Tax=Balneatrix alpica TaxID=75684 RepID=A0ABV5Z6P7_9GAMM|nr:response regulator [Balneatrix alpica]